MISATLDAVPSFGVAGEAGEIDTRTMTLFLSFSHHRHDTEMKDVNDLPAGDDG
jgi:hypothetical protein